jgi:hypothetical protein
MCVSTCQVTNGDAFSITTVPPGGLDVVLPTTPASLAAAAFAATLSAVGTLFLDTANGAGAPAVAAQNKAVCLYDFLLIAGGRDTNGVEADRYCGNALNPAPLAVPAGAATATTPILAAAVPGGSATSVQVCSKLCRITPY